MELDIINGEISIIEIELRQLKSRNEPWSITIENKFDKLASLRVRKSTLLLALQEILQNRLNSLAR